MRVRTKATTLSGILTGIRILPVTDIDMIVYAIKYDALLLDYIANTNDY